MDATHRLIKGNTPMLILSLLTEKPMHGYAIAKEIEQRTAELLRFREGTLYPTLHEMERKGWIQGRWQTTDGGLSVRCILSLPWACASYSASNRYGKSSAMPWKRSSGANHRKEAWNHVQPD